MNRTVAMALLALSGSGLAGCVSSQTFVDPQYHRTSYESIQRLSQPIPVNVDVHFQRNGKPLPAVDNELRGHVEQTLRASGAFVPASTNTQATIDVTGNNVADLAAARASGFKTGLTFGGSGSVVDDNYEFVFVYKRGEETKTFSYQHALHTTIGHAQAPPGMKPTTSADGFARVVEDVVLNFIKDLQDSGVLPKQ